MKVIVKQMKYNLYSGNMKDMKKITSLESTCYIRNDLVYKIFKPNIDISKRIEIIKLFLNNKVEGCPEIYDLIYEDNMVIGYIMKYYSRLKEIKNISNFNFVKQKLLELINLHLFLMEKYNIFYFDYNDHNVFLNKKNILLLDIDSCFTENDKSEFATNILIDFILSVIYKINYFDIRIYFLPEERQIIEDIIYTNYNGERIKNIYDIKNFINNVSSKDIKMQLKRMPYKLK